MSTFNFKHFRINQTNSGLKIGTDAFLLGALTNYENVKTVLDVGTGTGVLALIAAQFNSTCEVTAIEIDELNFRLAQENFNQSKWKTRLEVFHCDFLAFNPNKKFDLIVSNPPYFENSTKTNSDRKNLAKHNPSLTPDKLFKKVKHTLTENGVFWCILPFNHSEEYLQEAKNNKLFVSHRIEIFGKPEVLRRYIYCFSVVKQITTSQTLTVRDGKGHYTKEYKELTKELHDRSL